MNSRKFTIWFSSLKLSFQLQWSKWRNMKNGWKDKNKKNTNLWLKECWIQKLIHVVPKWSLFLPLFPKLQNGGALSFQEKSKVTMKLRPLIMRSPLPFIAKIRVRVTYSLKYSKFKKRRLLFLPLGWIYKV